MMCRGPPLSPPPPQDPPLAAAPGAPPGRHSLGRHASRRAVVRGRLCAPIHEPAEVTSSHGRRCRRAARGGTGAAAGGRLGVGVGGAAGGTGEGSQRGAAAGEDGVGRRLARRLGHAIGDGQRVGRPREALHERARKLQRRPHLPRPAPPVKTPSPQAIIVTRGNPTLACKLPKHLLLLVAPSDAGVLLFKESLVVAAGQVLGVARDVSISALA